MNEQLTLYFTSDTHGYFLPTDFLNDVEQDMGLAKIKTMIEKDGNTLLVDGGDTLQGSPLMTYIMEKGEAPFVAQLMNAIGYDYVTIGNHDFNHGRESLLRYLNALDATCLIANIIDDLKQWKPIGYAVRTLENGLRVGLIGATTDHVSVWESADSLNGLRITSALEAFKRCADSLREQVDVLVGIYHGGFERALATGELLSTSNENLACQICETVPLDVLLTGHQHMPISGKYRGVHIVQTPANAKAFAKVTVVKKQDGLAIDSQLISPTEHADSKILQMLQDTNEHVQKWLDTPAGYFPYALMPKDKLIMARDGNAIADFINQVMLWATGAQLSCTSLANDVSGFKAVSTVRDVVATYPYQNSLVTLRVTGAVLKTALERMASYFDKDDEGELVVSQRFLLPKVEHYNYDYVMGLYYEFDISKPCGERVVQMRYHGKPIGITDTLTMCMTDYRASGTGGYEVYRDCPRLAEAPNGVSEYILKYLAVHDDIKLIKSDYKVY